MPELTPEQEERIIKDLVALDYVHDLDGPSRQIVGEHLGCSPEEAERILQQLEERKLIERVSESGGRPAADRQLKSYGWAWVRTRRR